MENLKKGIRSAAVFISVSLLFIAGSVTAQDYKVLQQAFKDSYTYENNGDYTRAAEAIRKHYDESSYEINLRLGWVLYKAGQFTESSSYYQRAINLKPYAIEARLGLSYPATSLGQTELVKNQYLEILKIAPEYTLVNYKLGLLYYQREDYANALKYFEKVVNLFPFDYDSVLMFAWTHFRQGKLREAKVLFNKVLLISPNDKSALEGISLIK